MHVRLTGVTGDLDARLRARIAGQWPGLGADGRDDVTIALDGLLGDAAWFEVALRLGVLTSGRRPDRALASSGTPKLSRRDLFGLLGLGRDGAQQRLPRVIPGVCQSATGCRRCAEACPVDALIAIDGHLSLDDALCLHCGSCASACPVGALNQPPSSEDAAELVFDVVASFAASAGGIVLVFTCVQPPAQPWAARVEVPDVGTVGVRWLVRAAACGVVGVIVNCVDGGCAGCVAARQAVAAVAALIGDGGPAIRFIDGPVGDDELAQIRQSGRPALPVRDTGDCWTTYAKSVAALARPEAVVEGIGFTGVTVGEACTSCGACSKACGLGALRLEADSALTFMASACPGCGACAHACPEHCLTLCASGVCVSDVGARIVVHTDEVVNCRQCGQPVGPKSMLLKVAGLLGSPGQIDDRCANCKLH